MIVKSGIRGNKYEIARAEFGVKEVCGFTPPGRRYTIFDGEVGERPEGMSRRWKLSSVRLKIQPGEATRPMRYTDRRLGSIRAVASGRGHQLLVLPPGQVICEEVKAGDEVTFGLRRGGVDCFVADWHGRKPAVVIGVDSPKFEEENEKVVEESDPRVPADFWAAKRLLEHGVKTLEVEGLASGEGSFGTKNVKDDRRFGNRVARIAAIVAEERKKGGKGGRYEVAIPCLVGRETEVRVGKRREFVGYKPDGKRIMAYVVRPKKG